MSGAPPHYENIRIEVLRHDLQAGQDLNEMSKPTVLNPVNCVNPVGLI